MSVFSCVECGSMSSPGWWEVAEGRWLCGVCRQAVLDVFALAATLGITGTDLLMAVCEED